MLRLLFVSALGLVAVIVLAAGLGLIHARVHVERPVHDLGDVPQGKEISTVFTFKNRGLRTLTVSGIQAKCACTTELISGSDIRPFGRGKLKVTVKTEGKMGNVEEVVTLVSNAANGPVSFTVRANVLYPLEVRPSSVFFGTVSTEALPQRRQVFVRPGNMARSFEIASACSQTNALEIGLRRLDDGLYSMDLVLGEATPLGELRDEVLLRVAGVEDHPVRLPVMGRIIGPIEVAPSSLFYGDEPGRDKIRRAVYLVNRGRHPWEVRGVSSTLGSALHVQVSPDDKGYQLVCTLLPGQVVGPTHGFVRIETSLPRQPLIEIPVTIFSRREPTAARSPPPCTE